MASLTNYTKDGLINLIFSAAAFTAPTTLYVSLHTASPGGTGANEVGGGSYARQVVTFTNSTGGAGAVENETEMEFTMPLVSVSHFAIWDAATAGNSVWQGELRDSGGNPVTRSFVDGDIFRVAIGGLDCTIV